MSHILSFTDNHLPPHLLVNVKNIITPEQFEELCRADRDLRLELTSTGELIAMPPTGSKTVCVTPISISNLQLGPKKTAQALALILLRALHFPTDPCFLLKQHG